MLLITTPELYIALSDVLVITVSEGYLSEACSSLAYQRCNGQRRDLQDHLRGVPVSGVLAMTTLDVKWLAACSSLPYQRCNGQRRALQYHPRGVAVSYVLAMTTSYV